MFTRDFSFQDRVHQVGIEEHFVPSLVIFSGSVFPLRKVNKPNDYLMKPLFIRQKSRELMIREMPAEAREKKPEILPHFLNTVLWHL
jgi:hypothetical protein